MLFVVIAHDIESSFCLPTPPHPSPLLSPPRLLVLAHVSAYRFHGPPRKRHHLTGRSNSGENRVLRGTGLHYVTRVTACTSISISREIKIEKKEKRKRKGENLFPSTLSLFDRRADSRYLRIDNRRGTTVIHIDRWLRNATRE